MGYQHIETVQLDSATNQITFTNIPQDGQDLVALVSARSSDGTIQLYTHVQNDNSSSYRNRFFYGTGSSVFTSSSTTNRFDAFAISPSSSTSGAFGYIEIYIPNYTKSGNKVITSTGGSENNGTTAYAGFNAGKYVNSGAITTITFNPFSNTLASGSTLSLYKITAD